MTDDEKEMPRYYYYVVKDVKRFQLVLKKRLPEKRLDVEFWMTNEEWFEIFVNVLNIEKALPESQVQMSRILDDEELKKKVKVWVIGFYGEIPSFPMMSRINDKYENDVLYEKDEVEVFKQECLELNEITSNSIALLGLKKLISICEMAQKRNSAIYFLCR
jgi:hypothetical protein